ncbi:MAG: TrkA family potassium uptake protein [Clostridia bacterium]|nr:TrkA family potassium uptake protein [Clostridia bacterium]
MKRKNKTKYGVIGLGRFGMQVVQELSLLGADVLAIDYEQDRVSIAREYTPHALFVPTIDEKSLIEAGVKRCDVVIICMTELIDLSILTTLQVINLGIPRVISKAGNRMHGKILARLGAEVVFPERDMAVRLATMLENSGVLDVVQLSEQINISKLEVPLSYVGKTVLEVNFRENYGLNIIAIERVDGVLDNIMPDYVFAQGDVLYLAGRNEGMSRLSQAIDAKEND